jgi:N-acetylmuramoyl-L-alanine amidase
MIFRFLIGVILLLKAGYAFDVILDIGHTPKKSGAISASCKKEHELNLALGKYLIAHATEKSAIELNMLANEEITFQERYASSSHKNLFLSLHHDSVQERYIKKNSFGCPTTENISGFSIFISRKNPYFKQSLIYAKRFADALVSQGLTPSFHHAEKIEGENRELLDPRRGIYVFDDLKVLKNTKSPALLFEAGVIVNPKEETYLNSNEFKKKVANAIEAIPLK